MWRSVRQTPQARTRSSRCPTSPSGASTSTMLRGCVETFRGDLSTAAFKGRLMGKVAIKRDLCSRLQTYCATSIPSSAMRWIVISAPTGPDRPKVRPAPRWSHSTSVNHFSQEANCGTTNPLHAAPGPPCSINRTGVLRSEPWIATHCWIPSISTNPSSSIALVEENAVSALDGFAIGKMSCGMPLSQANVTTVSSPNHGSYLVRICVVGASARQLVDHPLVTISASAMFPWPSLSRGFLRKRAPLP